MPSEEFNEELHGIGRKISCLENRQDREYSQQIDVDRHLTQAHTSGDRIVILLDSWKAKLRAAGPPCSWLLLCWCR